MEETNLSFPDTSCKTSLYNYLGNTSTSDLDLQPFIPSGTFWAVSVDPTSLSLATCLKRTEQWRKATKIKKGKSTRKKEKNTVERKRWNKRHSKNRNWKENWRVKLSVNSKTSEGNLSKLFNNSLMKPNCQILKKLDFCPNFCQNIGHSMFYHWQAKENLNWGFSKHLMSMWYVAHGW